MIRLLAPALPLALALALPSPTEAQLHNRLLDYPAATEAGRPPPTIDLHPGGATRVVFVDDAPSLQPRAIFVTRPDAWMLTADEAGLNIFSIAESAGEATLFVTTSKGTTLTFALAVIDEAQPADAVVTVRQGRAVQVSLSAPKPTDSLSQALAAAPSIELSTPHLVDKQHGLWFRLLPTLHLGEKTYARIQIENRDPSGPPWYPGETQLTLVDEEGRREALASVVTYGTTPLGPGDRTIAVLAFISPQLPRGTQLELLLSEQGGQRHLVIDDLAD